jgi:membrane protease subunit HflC
MFKKIQFIIFFVISLIALSDSAFIVNQGEQAIVLQFGKIVSEEILDAGLHFKIPFIDKAHYFEKKVLGFSSELREAIAADQKRVLVDTYTKYKISDPLVFYQSVRNERNLALRISPIVESATREAIAKVSLNCFVSECRNDTITFIKKNVITNSKSFGIEIVDVRVKTVGFPGENLESIFSRMKTDRAKEAKEIRATGFQEKSIITSTADKESAYIISDAKLKSATLKGEADAEAAKIYNTAFGKDLDYFQYLRYLETYKKTLNSQNTLFILNEENDYLKFLLKNLGQNNK